MWSSVSAREAGFSAAEVAAEGFTVTAKRDQFRRQCTALEPQVADFGRGVVNVRLQ